MAALAVSVLAPLGMSIATAAPASADQAWGENDTSIPSYFTETGGAGNEWYDKRYPGRKLVANGDITEDPFGQQFEDDWMYPDYPITCNPTPGDANHYSTFWIYGSEEPNLFDQALARDVIRAATSIFAASAKEKLGPTSNGGIGSLKNAHTPRWKTTAPGGAGNCYPHITVLQVPQEYLKSTDGNVWHPYRPGELESYLKAQGHIADKDEKFVGLIQNWGTGDAYRGITGFVENDTQPGKANANNNGADSVYVDMDMPRNAQYSKNVYTDSAHALAHEMTHDLGSGSGIATNLANGGHAKDCFDLLCNAPESQPGSYAVAACGATSTPTYGSVGESKFSVRLDCNGDDYWSINGAPWTATHWNTFNSSFLWANSGNEQ